LEKLHVTLRELREVHGGAVPVLQPKFRRFRTLAKDTELYRGREVVRIRNPKKHKPKKGEENRMAISAADQIILQTLEDFSRK